MRWHWARWRAFVHATEDEPRVWDALLWLMAQDEDEKGGDRIERKRAKGHWGNDIAVLEGALTKQPAIQAALARVFHDDAVRESVAKGLSRSLDEDGVLHLRLDKQAAVLNRVKQTGGGDAVIVTVKAELWPGESLEAVWQNWLKTAVH